MVRLELRVPPSAAPSPWAAIPSFLQGHPGGEARLVPVARAALMGPTLFQGVCWHMGSGRTRMRMVLLGSAVGWPLSKCDGAGAVPAGDWSPSLPHQPFAKPQAAPGGLVLVWLGRRCCNLLSYLCSAAAPPFPGIYPWEMEAAADGQGRGRTPPCSIPTWGGGPAPTPTGQWHNAEPPLPPRPSTQCLREKL